MVKHSEGGKWYNGCNYANKQNFFGKYVGSGVTYLNEIVNTGLWMVPREPGITAQVIKK